MAYPSVHVIILNRNGFSFLKGCIESLEASDYRNRTLWLVDNDSNDGSPDWVETNYPFVRVLRTGGNWGWSGGNNAGIRRALDDRADYVWILNNDVEVDTRCVSALVDCAERHDRPAIVGPRIYFFDPRERLWFEGGKIDDDSYRAGHCCYDEFKALSQRNRYITGCALMVRREVFEKIGLMDERFFIYYEDADFCRRAADAGFSMDVERSAIMYHKVSAYSGGSSGLLTPFQAYQTLRSELLFWRKHSGWVRFHRGYCAARLGNWLNQISEWVADPARAESAQALIDAVWYYLAGYRAPRERPSAPKWFRKAMQKKPWVIAELMAWRLPGLGTA